MPIKRWLKWLLGWVYAWRRRVGTLTSPRRRGSGASAAHPHATASAVSESLPAGALDCLLAANVHGLYCVPRSSSHRPVSQAIVAADVWEEDTLELLRAADPHGDIVHAGTFFGDFVPALARSRGEGSKVWAFEPQPENYRATQITILLNDLSNVVLTNAGLGAERARALLATTDRKGTPLGGGSRVIRDRARAHWWANERVELLTLDEVLGDERRVAAIHLDVEGHEQEALKGAIGTIERCRPLIVLETMPEAGWLERTLLPLGYRACGSVNLNHVLRCE